MHNGKQNDPPYPSNLYEERNTHTQLQRGGGPLDPQGVKMEVGKEVHATGAKSGGTGIKEKVAFKKGVLKKGLKSWGGGPPGYTGGGQNHPA